MTSTISEVSEDSPSYVNPKRNTPMWRSILVAIGITLAMVVGPTVFPADSPVGSTVSQADASTHTYAKCYYTVAGWLVKTRPCDSVHQLPVVVKQCIFGLAGGAAVAVAIGGPLAPAVAGALVGCGGSLIRK